MSNDPLSGAKREISKGVDHAADAAQQAKDDLGKSAENVVDVAQQAADDVQTGAKNVARDAQRAADDVQTGAKNAARDAQQQGSNLASQAASGAESALTATGETLDNLAQTVRQNAPSGAVGDYAKSTAAALEQGADYLKQADIDDVWHDVSELVRRRPLGSLVVAFGVGYLFFRAFRR